MRSSKKTGAKVESIGTVTGVYSRPDRDPRFHAVTICVRANGVAAVVGTEQHPRDSAKRDSFIPTRYHAPLAMTMDDMLDDALRSDSDVTLE